MNTWTSGGCGAGRDRLRSAIDRTLEPATAAPAGEQWPWRFARCWMLTASAQEGGGGLADVDQALAEFDAVPAGVPGRAKLAGLLAEAMFMLHHYIRVEGLAAPDALRAAQLWMLDTDRKPPETMPAELRSRLTGGHGIDIAAWAGFYHCGR